jgi:hypothetical protein
VVVDIDGSDRETSVAAGATELVETGVALSPHAAISNPATANKVRRFIVFNVFGVTSADLRPFRPPLR